MKKLFVISYFFIFGYGCNIDNRIYDNSASSHRIGCMVTPTFEKLDTSIIQKLRSRAKNSLETFYGKTNDTFFSSRRIQISTNKNVILYTLDLDYGEYSNVFYRINSYFYFGKSYYKNGNIKSKGIRSFLGFNLGKSYSFDEQGKLINIHNSDIGYDFNFDKVLHFFNKKHISLIYHEGDSQRVTVRKGKFYDRAIWSINAYYLSKWSAIALDGMTGRLLKLAPGPIYLE